VTVSEVSQSVRCTNDARCLPEKIDYRQVGLQVGGRSRYDRLIPQGDGRGFCGRSGEVGDKFVTQGESARFVRGELVVDHHGVAFAGEVALRSHDQKLAGMRRERCGGLVRGNVQLFRDREKTQIQQARRTRDWCFIKTNLATLKFEVEVVLLRGRGMERPHFPSAAVTTS
jgi:hypothetical protein